MINNPNSKSVNDQGKEPRNIDKESNAISLIIRKPLVQYYMKTMIELTAILKANCRDNQTPLAA